MTKALQVPDDYPELLEQLKDRIRAAQVRAALSVNRELVLLYWHISHEILARQQTAGWGTKVIDRLSEDLRREFPKMKGFSPRNLKYMRAFAEAWPDQQIVQQAVAQIPWGHNVRILDKLSTAEERTWYVQQTLEHGWSRDVLFYTVTELLPAELAGSLPTIDELEAELDRKLNADDDSSDQPQ